MLRGRMEIDHTEVDCVHTGSCSPIHRCESWKWLEQDISHYNSDNVGNQPTVLAPRQARSKSLRVSLTKHCVCLVRVVGGRSLTPRLAPEGARSYGMPRMPQSPDMRACPSTKVPNVSLVTVTVTVTVSVCLCLPSGGRQPQDRRNRNVSLRGAALVLHQCWDISVGYSSGSQRRCDRCHLWLEFQGRGVRS